MTHSIAIITNSAPPYRIAFHERLIRECPQFHIYSLFTHAGGSARWSHSGLERVHAVSFGDGDSSEARSAVRHAIRELRRGGRVVRWLRQNAIEAVVLGGYDNPGYLRVMHWCQRASVPCFLLADSNIYGDVARGWRRFVKKWILTQVKRWCAGVLVCGSLGQAYYESYGFPRCRMFYVPYEPDYALIQGLSTEFISTTLASLGLDAKRRRIVFSGRLVPVKRPEIAVQAFQRIARDRPNWDMVVVGDGVLRPQLEAMVAAPLRGRITFTGFLDDQAQISAIYRGSDILLLPSRDEPWGLVVNEALAAGMAIMCTDVVGAGRELVQHGLNGRLMPRDATASEWGDALLTISNNDDIDNYKAHSVKVLDHWRHIADPVIGFVAAIKSCGLS